MSDERNEDKTSQDSYGSLIEQVKNDLKKGKREAVKAKLKVVMTKREEAEKVIRLLDLEASKIVEDFKNGVD